jgi:hypothetical protein
VECGAQDRENFVAIFRFGKVKVPTLSQKRDKGGAPG